MSVFTVPEANSADAVAPEPISASRWRRWARRVLKFSMVAAVLLGALMIFHRPLLVGFAHLFRVDNPAPSDAIVLLLGGLSHRPAMAAELYHRGIAPIVLLCHEKEEEEDDEDFAHHESESVKNRLIRLGVPPDAIVTLPSDVTSTREEAQRIRIYLETHPARRITIVTSSFHTARSLWIFRRVLAGLPIDIRAAAAPHPKFTESDWFETERGLMLYFEEIIKTFYYRLKY